MCERLEGTHQRNVYVCVYVCVRTHSGSNTTRKIVSIKKRLCRSWNVRNGQRRINSFEWIDFNRFVNIGYCYTFINSIFEAIRTKEATDKNGHCWWWFDRWPPYIWTLFSADCLNGLVQFYSHAGPLFVRVCALFLALRATLTIKITMMPKRCSALATHNFRTERNAKHSRIN